MHCIRLRHRQVKRVRVNLYKVDLELVFSSMPFPSADGRKCVFSYIQQTQSRSWATRSSRSWSVPISHQGAEPDVDLSSCREVYVIRLLTRAARSVSTFWRTSLATSTRWT